MNKSNENMEKQIQKAIDELIAKGVPPKTAAYAAAMGYIKKLNNKK